MTEHASSRGSGRPWRRRGGRHARGAYAYARPAEAAESPESDTTGSRATATEARPGSIWREIPVIVVLAIAFSVLIKTFLAQAFYIPSISMEDTLLLNDRVVVNKLTDDAGSIERGDIVVFRDPGGWLDEPLALEPSGARGVLRDTLVFLGLAPSADEEDLIKRVIGIGGDHVVCCDAQARITVNDVALDEKDYLFPGDVPSEDTFDVTVPPGSLWLLGDHRSRSADARRHQDDERGGMVPADGVIGRAFVLVWPLDRATIFSTPQTFDQSAFGTGRSAAQVGTPASAVPATPAADLPAPQMTP
jgi:signal peptidase I